MVAQIARQVVQLGVAIQSISNPVRDSRSNRHDRGRKLSGICGDSPFGHYKAGIPVSGTQMYDLVGQSIPEGVSSEPLHKPFTSRRVTR